MRVWVLSNEYYPRIIGGLGTVATYLTKSLVEQGGKVKVISDTSAEQIKTTRGGNLSIFRFPLMAKSSREKRNLFIFNWLNKRRFLKPDVIHIHSVNFMSLARIYQRRYGIPIIYTCHSLVRLDRGSKRSSLFAQRQETLLKLANLIIVPSKWMKESVTKLYPNLVRKVEVIDNGIIVCNSTCGCPGNQLLFVGRIVPRKGVTELIEAIAKLEKTDPEITLDIVGKGSTLYVENLKKLAAQLGIASKIRWLGFHSLEAVQKMYRNYGAVIVPSKREPFGLVALEALANGVPLISSASDGLSQFVDDTVAEVIPSVTSEAIASAVENMLQNEAKTRERIENGLKRASLYDWKEVTKTYYDAFARLRASKTTSGSSDAKWNLVNTWKAKDQGQVWIVKNSNGQRGYFKFATKEQWYFSGPMVANEFISAALAKRLGFPVAELEMATVSGPNGKRRRGLVSKEEQASEVITWREADKNVQQNPERFVDNLDYLKTMVVFDAWIANIDRALGKNLVLYRNSPDERYNWYLIDHGHCLYGSPRKWKRGKWNAPIWEQLWRVYHVPKGLARIQSSTEALEPMIQKIESLEEKDIDDAIRSVPNGYLQDEERQFIKRLLLYRQKNLRSIIKKWLAYNGLKESRKG